MQKQRNAKKNNVKPRHDMKHQEKTIKHMEKQCQTMKINDTHGETRTRKEKL